MLNTNVDLQNLLSLSWEDRCKTQTKNILYDEHKRRFIEPSVSFTGETDVKHKLKTFYMLNTNVDLQNLLSLLREKQM